MSNRFDTKVLYLAAGAVLVWLAVVGGVVYVAVHFIGKFW